MILKPTPPIPLPGDLKPGRLLGKLLLAGGGLALGYALKKWQERNNMNTFGNAVSTGASSTSFDEPYPIGRMESKSGKNISLKSVSITGDITGLLFSSTIRQEYKNETSDPLEVIYTFPLGWGTALLGMQATIGDKKLCGEVVEKAQAEAQYEEAISEGNSAIMLQQSSCGL